MFDPERLFAVLKALLVRKGGDCNAERLLSSCDDMFQLFFLASCLNNSLTTSVNASAKKQKKKEKEIIMHAECEGGELYGWYLTDPCAEGRI